MNTHNKEDWFNWSELYLSYMASRSALDEFIRDEKNIVKKDIDNLVNLELARSMRADLSNSEKEIKNKIIYAMNTIGKEDMKAAGLSKNEIKITMLRQHYSIKQVSEILKVTKRYVYMVYQSSVEKVLRYKKIQEKNKILHRFSPQQKKIIQLMEQGKSHKEIIETLGITPGTLKTQKKRIKKKLGGTKTLHNQLQVKCAQN